MSKLVKQDRTATALMADRVVKILNGASDMLAQATTIQQNKLIADIAHAQKIYAARQNLGKSIVAQAQQIELTALTQLGELLAAMPKAKGTRLSGRKPGMGPNTGIGGAITEPPMDVPTYAELGIDKKTAMVAQRLAALPQETRTAIQTGEQKLRDGLATGRKAEHKKRFVQQELPKGKHAVIYADPPWKYNDSGVINDSDSYGRAERHYPTMSVDEICALPVRDRVATNAVLFLWVTAPLLPDAFKVIDAWGFTYKQNIVWDKDAHNAGHYVSVRHEHLLIATRGSMVPDYTVANNTHSVQRIKRTSKHSEKPAQFRELIDTLYPPVVDGDRVELFARDDVPAHWKDWGNEKA